MTEYDALYRAVLENPGDDTPRLVLADWLDETGKPAAAARAEFIRLQVEHGTGGATAHPRETALLNKWGVGWLPKVGRQAARFYHRVTGRAVEAGVANAGVYGFARGFPNRVWLDDVFCPGDQYLNGHGVGRMVQDCLAAAPFEEFRFTPSAAAETLLIQAGRYVREWFLASRVLSAGQFSPVGAPDAHRFFPTRREMAAGAIEFVAEQVAAAAFTPAGIPF